MEHGRISIPFTLLLLEGLRNHNFIIPRPKQKNKGNMDENAGNARENTIFPSDFLPGACRDEAEG